MRFDQMPGVNRLVVRHDGRGPLVRVVPMVGRLTYAQPSLYVSPMTQKGITIWRTASNAAITESGDGSEELMINIESFLIEIDQIPWFANVGKPSELDGQALRITSWRAWPGPETPGSGLMQETQVNRHERLLAAGDPLQIKVVSVANGR